MLRFPTFSSTGPIRAMGPVLLALLAAAVVPTGCVLWFMNVAMRNERLAMQQRLADVYRQHLVSVRQKIDEHWSARLDAMEKAAGLKPAEAAEELVRTGTADGIIILDATGAVVFPAIAEFLPPPSDGYDPLRDLAEELELEQNHAKAAEFYAQVAQRALDVHRKAQAFQGQARCLARAGQIPAAIAILSNVLAGDDFREAREDSGRLIAPNALMHALQLMPRDSDAWRAAVRDLAARLRRYDGPAMPAGQRLLLMRELRAIADVDFPLLPAEELAAAYLDAGAITAPSMGLRPSAAKDVWTLAPAGGRVIGLLRETTVSTAHDSIRSSIAPPPGTRIVLHETGRSSEEPFLAIPAGDHAPDWRLSLHLDAPDASAIAAERRIALYLWTGGLGIALIAGLTLAAGGYVGRQMRLTRLKNDLIATVSHELKTPLASMRALVDTLLDGRCTDPRQAREYLGLIAKENQRLSRLIDNFLTFSRMERNKRTFEFNIVSAAEIVQLAGEAVRERFAAPGCRLEVEVADDLPALRGDRDALVTVIVNLLDNAWKYTSDEKLVRLRAFAEDGGLCIEVSDNGIGLSRRSIQRIFDRFYQVDQTLSRQAGGCGLGLSIVKFIVEAHGGEVSVQSQPGQGSTFRVKLPARPF